MTALNRRTVTDSLPPINTPERPVITVSIKSLRHIEMNVKIISFEATFKTILVGGITDMFREREREREFQIEGTTLTSDTDAGVVGWH